MKIESLQVIRAYAACLVAMCHIYNDGWLPGTLVDFGTFGVDLFFVLSGFIMCYTAKLSENKVHNAWYFMKRRVIRIFPIYLICAIPLIWWVTKAEGVKPPYFYIGNLLLLPSFTDDPEYRMALPPGWTLVYEMLFYYLFSFFLLWSTERKKVCLSVFSALIIIVSLVNILGAQGPRLSWVNFSYIVGDYQVINFALGILLYFIYSKYKDRSIGLKTGVGVIILMSLISMIIMYAKLPHYISHPIPAFVIVSTILFVRNDALGSAFWKKIIFIGNASYSIYLTHFYFAFFKLKVITFVGRFIANRDLLVNAVDIVLLAGAILAGCAFYLLIEKPIIKRVSVWTR